MTSRAHVLDRFNILQRSNSFLISNRLKPLNNFEGLGNNFITNLRSISCQFITEDNVAPITISHLDHLYYSTIYLSDETFNSIDYILDFKESSHCDTIKSWIEPKLSLKADQIELECRKSVQNPSNSFIEKWISRQAQGKPIDSDLLAIRVMETLVLLAITNFHLFDEDCDFKVLEDKLMDWSEAIGLIRSLSDNQFTLTADASMDIDFNPSADSSQISTIYDLKPKYFDVYLLEKFKNCKRIKEIVEIVSERCGIPVDSDFEDEKKPNIPTEKKPQTKHWRRVKPATLPIKRVTSAKVNRPSSLSVSEVKSSRFLTSSSTRQVDLTIKPLIETNSTNERNRRRHSEASAPQIIQQTTPTKSKKTFLSTAAAASANNNNNNNSNLSDSFVILETPPRVLSTKHVPLNDLTSSVRRLFPQQSMEE